MGLGITNVQHSPSLLSLPNNERISFITCGYNYTICLTETNLCYVWGGNYYGQLGLGDFDNCYSPTLFSLPNNETISFITCGFGFSLFLTLDNLLYFSGKLLEMESKTPILINFQN